MAPEAHLTAWESYYVIVGSSGAALIGLQFVVITLIAGMRRPTAADTLGAFGTPTVVHLTGALLVSAIMSAPWPSLLPPSITLALYGLGGLVYGAIVIQRARRQSGYKPVWEDWLWFTILPCGGYAALTLGAVLLPGATTLASFVVGAAALGLLLIGIHNAWDTVTHLVTRPDREEPGQPPRGAMPQSDGAGTAPASSARSARSAEPASPPSTAGPPSEP